MKKITRNEAPMKQDRTMNENIRTKAFEDD
jgi:hypothetical protein